MNVCTFIINVYLWFFSRTFYVLCVIFSSSERTLLVKGQLISKCIFGRNDVFIKPFRFLLTLGNVFSLLFVMSSTYQTVETQTSKNR